MLQLILIMSKRTLSLGNINKKPVSLLKFLKIRIINFVKIIICVKSWACKKLIIFQRTESFLTSLILSKLLIFLLMYLFKNSNSWTFSNKM